MIILYLIRNLRVKNLEHSLKIVSIGTITLLPIMCWYLISVPQWESNRIQIGIFDNTISIELVKQYLYIQLTETIPKLVLNQPASLLFLVALPVLYKRKHSSYIYLGLLAVCLYFLFVLKQIRGTHDYYLFPLLPIVLLSHLNLIDFLWANRISRILILSFCITMPIYCWQNVKDNWDIEKAYFNKDFFQYGNEIANLIPANVKSIIANDRTNSIIPYLCDQDGYIFRKDHLPVAWIKDIIERQDAQYFISDSRIIENQEGFKVLMADTIYYKESIKVFKLKGADEL